MDQHIERWQKIIDSNEGIIRMLDAGEIRLYRGGTLESDCSAIEATRLRGINDQLRQLIAERENLGH